MAQVIQAVGPHAAPGGGVTVTAPRVTLPPVADRSAFTAAARSVGEVTLRLFNSASLWGWGLLLCGACGGRETI